MRRTASTVVAGSWSRKLALALVIFGALATGCGVGPRLTGEGGEMTATQEMGPEATSTFLPLDDATVTASAAPAPAVVSEQLDFCFNYPDGFTQVGGEERVEVIGPYSGSGPEPGLMWADVTDAEGRAAEDVANEEVDAVGGLNPPRYTVLLGGEEALVLDGMPGQDAVRKVYIVHGERLYTLTFSPYRSENLTANAQMETLYASVTSSWVWKSSGKPCAVGN